MMPPPAMAGMDVYGDGNMPPHAMGGMNADHMGNMPPEAMAGMDGPMMHMMPPELWAVWDMMSNATRRYGRWVLCIWNDAATSDAAMDADMMGNMPPHAMGGMNADHMGNMPPEAMVVWMDL